jgi:hypothetical protein
MALPVVTVASGGLPVVEVTGFGLPVTEAANARGIAVTKVAGKPGLGVTFVSETGGPVVIPATWNPADKSANIALSNGNLTAQATSTADGGVRATAGKTTGKYYFEILWSSSLGGGDTGCGIATAAAVLSSIGVSAVGAALVFVSGNVYFNGSNVGSAGTMPGAPFTICVAADLGNSRIWFRPNGGNWNNSGTANPATNAGGFNIAALFPGSAAYPVMALNLNTTPTYTANFGATAFAQPVPSGFTAGWG